MRAIQPYLEAQGNCEIVWVLRDKDVACQLASRFGIRYVVISKAATGLIGNAWEMFINIFRCMLLTRRLGIDAWLTKYGAGNMAAALLGKPSISFNDDDVDQVPLIALTSYPFARAVICPDVLRMGKYDNKALRYPGCHELFYLHPNRFEPDARIYQELGLEAGERFVLVRLSALTAHHDANIRGLSDKAISSFLSLCKERDVKCFISSERTLPEYLKAYQLSLAVDRVHHALYYATLFVGDSQTMTSEAAVLGTPAIRFSDFKGRLSVIDELERYGLTTAISPDHPEELLARASECLDGSGQEAFRRAHQAFLKDKIDPAPWFADQIKKLLKADRS